MRVLVVGGGMGGTIFANNLARRIHNELKSGKASITMLSASDKHMYQPGLLYVALGRMTPDELYREQASLLEPCITLHVDPVETFNLKDNHVVTKGGKTHEYDVIVIATGSRAMPELIPGLAENSVNCYTEANSLDFFEKLSAFKGGRILITVGLPHKCPMIPLEITLTMHDFIADRGLLGEDRVLLHLSDRPSAQPGERRQMGGRRIRAAGHQDRDPLQPEGSRRQERQGAQRGRVGPPL